MRVFLCEKPSQATGHRPCAGCRSTRQRLLQRRRCRRDPCIGHLVEAVPPEGYGEQYKRWAIEQLPILPERWRVEPKAATAAQFRSCSSSSPRRASW